VTVGLFPHALTEFVGHASCASFAPTYKGVANVSPETVEKLQGVSSAL